MSEESASMRVAIRTDASAQIGAGHLMRCLSLATALRSRGAAVEFLMRRAAAELVEHVQASGYAISILKSSANGEFSPKTEYEGWLGVPWQVDAEETLAWLKRGAVDWLVVDHYALNEPWERHVHAGCRAMLVIDDLEERRHFCDLLVDQNLQAQNGQPRQRVAGEGAVVLTGPRFAMLSPAFRCAREKGISRSHACARRIVLFFGGSDPTNETGKALAGLEQLPPGSFDVDVVAGVLNRNLGELEAACRKLGCRLHRGADMASLYASADFALGAPGTSSWERMCLGLPSLLVAVAQNQERIGQALDEAGCAFYLGKGCETTADQYAGILNSLKFLRGELRRQGSRGMELVDGRGAARVASRMIHWWLSLRAATLDDSESILAWRNSEAVRRWSFNQTPISREDHQCWMRKTLADPERLLLVAENANQPVGVVRFDCNDGAATISVFLDPSQMGQGLGPAILRNARRWLARERPDVTRIFADIVEGNRASADLFREAGYREFSARYVLTLH